jgi:hypothetical protein
MSGDNANLKFEHLGTPLIGGLGCWVRAGGSYS